MNSNNKTTYEIQSVLWSPMYVAISVMIVAMVFAAVSRNISKIKRKMKERQHEQAVWHCTRSTALKFGFSTVKPRIIS